MLRPPFVEKKPFRFFLLAGLFASLLLFSPLFARRWLPSQGTCKANLMSIRGAMESYTMGEKSPLDSTDFAKGLKQLVDKKYLPSLPKCPGPSLEIEISHPPFPYFLWTSYKVFKVDLPVSVPEYKIREKTGEVCCTAHGTEEEIKQTEKKYTEQFAGQLQRQGMVMGLVLAVLVFAPLLWFFKKRT